MAHNGQAPEYLPVIMHQRKMTHGTTQEAVVFCVSKYSKIIRYKSFALVILYPAMI